MKYLLLILTVSTLLAVDANPVQMYSDKKPNYTCIFTLDLSKQEKWLDESKEYHGRLDKRTIVEWRAKQSIETIEKLLKTMGFIRLPGGECIRSNHLDIILGSSTGEEIFFLQLQYHTQAKHPYFLTYTFGDNTTSTDLSWKWIHHCFSQMTSVFKKGRTPYESSDHNRIYNKIVNLIKANNLEHSLNRICVSVNQDHSYAFHGVFNTKKQEKIINKLLLTIYEKL